MDGISEVWKYLVDGVKMNLVVMTRNPPRAIKLPRAVAWREIIIPIIISIDPKVMAFFALMGVSSTFMNIAVKTGFITKATNNDDPKTMMSVIGKKNINSPISPGQTISGEKAARVVAVEAIIGQATSPTPYLAASIAFMPSSISR